VRLQNIFFPVSNDEITTIRVYESNKDTISGIFFLSNNPGNHQSVRGTEKKGKKSLENKLNCFVDETSIYLSNSGRALMI
jgi:hypothetical protein